MTSSLVWISEKTNNFKKYLDHALPKQSLIRAELMKIASLTPVQLISLFGPELLKYNEQNLSLLIELMAKKYKEDISKIDSEKLKKIEAYLNLFREWMLHNEDYLQQEKK